MNPDLQRLCEAAEGALENAGLQDLAARAGVSEAIVRAVLTALREPSKGMVGAGSSPDDDPQEIAGLSGMSAHVATFTAMIDHILAEPAERAGIR